MGLIDFSPWVKKDAVEAVHLNNTVELPAR